jgi:2-hydroxychromene-2-carboxylate isomerase
LTKVCEYYFSPQSPFAYLGHARFVALTKQYGVQVEIKPCEFGRIFSVSGGLPLAKRPPQRQAYRLAELERWRDHLQVPLNLHPKFFPVSCDAAARLIIATRLTHGTDTALAMTGAVMQALWAEEKNIADVDILASLACDLELDGKALLKSSDTASVQTQYDSFTDDAIAANVFGAPWYVFNGTGYWGQDRLDFLERALAA